MSYQNSFQQIEACVFDAYGTLFDVHTAVASLQQRIGPEQAGLSAAWRRRQASHRPQARVREPETTGS